VIGDAMFFNESDEIWRSKAREGRLGKVRIGREEIVGRAMNVGEIASASAGNQDFLAETVGALQHSYAASALPCYHAAEKAGGPATENDGVEFARR